MPFINTTLKKGKNVLVPLTMVNEKKLLAVHLTDPEKDLQPGYCGIPEPTLLAKNHPNKCIDPALIEAVIVPGSVFDSRGGRLGYGGGYYDRFLKNHAYRAIRIGLAFQLQMVDRLDLQPHDQLMDIIITENEIYHCKRGKYEKNSHIQR
jgi:5-formyltetrahydrofolate cyclo-ligase